MIRRVSTRLCKTFAAPWRREIFLAACACLGGVNWRRDVAA